MGACSADPSCGPALQAAVLQLVYGMTQGTLVASHELPASQHSVHMRQRLIHSWASRDGSANTCLGFFDLLRQADPKAKVCCEVNVGGVISRPHLLCVEDEHRLCAQAGTCL